MRAPADATSSVTMPGAIAASEAHDGWRALASDTALLLAGQYGSAGLSLLSTVVAAALAGPDAYGSAALAIAFPSLVWSLTTVKSGTVTTRYFSQQATAQEASAFFRLGVLIDGAAAMLALVVVVVAWALTHTMPGLGSFDALAVVFACSLPVSSLSGTALAFLTARRRFLSVACVQLFEKTSLLVLTAALLTLEYGATGIVIALAVSQALAGIAAVALCLRHEGLGASPWSGGLPHLGSRWPEVRAALAWNYLSSTTGGVLTNVPLLALGALRSPAEAGFCRLAMSLMNVSAYLDAAMARATYPRLAADQASTGVSRDCAMLTWRAGLPASLALIGVALLLPIAIPMTLGPTYETMVNGAQLMVLSVAATTAIFWVQPLLYASGRFRTWALVSGAVAASVAVLAGPVAAGAGFFGTAVFISVARMGSYIGGAILAFQRPPAAR